MNKFIQAKLFKGKGKWYVYYKVVDPNTGLLKMYKDYSGLGIKGLSNRERIRIANENISSINEDLKNGWSPLITTEAQKQAESELTNILDDFFKIKEASLRKRSISHYKYAIDLFKGFLKVNHSTLIKPTQFTKVMAHSFSDFLLVTKGHGNKTHNNHIASVSTFFSMMEDRDIIAKNPFKVVKRKPVDVGRNVAYSDEQREKIKEYLVNNSHPLLMMVQFIYYCFIRPNELMQLQAKHIDFKNKQIQIPAYASKNRKQSSVDIPDVFMKQVIDGYKEINPELYLFGRGLIPSPIAVHRNRASHAHKLVLEALKISNDHTLYSWKHSGVISMVESGTNLYKVMEQLRHSSLEEMMPYLKSLGLKINSESLIKQKAF